MDTKRQERVAKLIQKDVGLIFQTEMQHITKGAMVTVTKVKISPDMSLAKVYLSLFAAKSKEISLKNIKSHTSEIRHLLGNRIKNQLRVTPALNFYLDDSLDYIENIDNLLKE